MSNTRSSVISKKDTQLVIKDLRKSGYTVEKISSGYSCMHQGEVIFKAMIGSRGYLCTFNKGVFN